MKYFLLIFFTFYNFIAFTQDSLLVKKACLELESKKKLQFTIINDFLLEYMQSEEFSNSLNKFRDINNFGYKLSRGMIRNCPHSDLFEFPIKAHRVIDIEALLSKNEIDTLIELTSKLFLTENINFKIASIDDYFPSTTIKDFAQKKIIQWNGLKEPLKGDVLLIISTSNKSLYLSTTAVSTKYLDDKSCKEIINKITPFLKESQFFEAFIVGIEGVKEKLKHE